MQIQKAIALLLIVTLLAGTCLLCVSSLEPHGNNITFRNWAYNDPNYTFSSGYMTSRWYHNFASLTLTENQRNNVLRIALSQLGYHEGNSEADFNGMNLTANGNVTEYARLVLRKSDNKPYGEDGVTYSFNWCACFVNWCLSQARVDHTYAEISCGRWIDDWFSKEENEFHLGKAFGGTYTPRPADLIFFDWEGKNTWPDHIGFVLYTDETTVYTIEGNTKANNVGIRSYPLNSTFIRGYGVPAYVEGDEPICDFSYANGLPVGQSVVCTLDTTLTDTAGQAHSLPTGTAVLIEAISADGDVVTVRVDELSGTIPVSTLIPLPPVEAETESQTVTESAAPTLTDTPTETPTESETVTVTEAPVESETPPEATPETQAPTAPDTDSPASGSESNTTDSSDSSTDFTGSAEITDTQTESGCGATMAVMPLLLAVMAIAAIPAVKRKE